VFISRAKTGFSGIITVSAVLFVVQLITGVQAFPLWARCGPIWR